MIFEKRRFDGLFQIAERRIGVFQIEPEYFSVGVEQEEPRIFSFRGDFIVKLARRIEQDRELGARLGDVLFYVIACVADVDGYYAHALIAERRDDFFSHVLENGFGGQFRSRG